MIRKAIHAAFQPTAYGAALLGIAYLLSKSVFSAEPTVDFKHFWLAGDLWRDGVSPYTAEFSARSAALFPDESRAVNFSYLPNWWPVSVILALMPYDAAAVIWRSAGVVMAVASIAIVWRATFPERKFLDPLFAVSLAFTCFMSATPMTLAMGQNSALMLFGTALVIYGILRTRNLALIAGIVILMLKPQIGAPLAAFVLMRGGWKPVGIAALVTIAMTVPAFLVSGPMETISSVLGHFEGYEDASVNAASSMTGLRNLVWLASGADVSSAYFALAALISAALLGVFFRGPAPWAIIIMLATVVFIAPLHTYDLMIAAPLLILSFSIERGYMLWPGMGLMFKANTIATMTGLYPQDAVYFPGACIASIGLCMIFAAAVAGMIAKEVSR